MRQEVVKSDTKPFIGGIDTAHEIAVLPSGSFSVIQNMRPRNPGFEKRKGHAKQHTTADSVSETICIYQFSKGEQTERHLFRQSSDGKILEATNNPPTTTTGVFGSQVLDASSATPYPASWGNINDTMLMSDGARQHQIYPGNNVKLSGFHVYKGTSAIPDIPMEGEDYTDEVTDGKTSTEAILDSLNTLANYNCIFIHTSCRANTFTLIVSAVNSNATVMVLKYRKNDGTWADVSGFTNNTTSGGVALAQSGAMTWTMPTDEIPHFMYDKSGFWYQLYLSSGSFDSNTRVSSVTYSGIFQNIQNVWDGNLLDAAEVQFYDSTIKQYRTLSAIGANISGMTTNDYLYFAVPDPIIGFYLEALTPNKPFASITSTDLTFVDGSTGDDTILNAAAKFVINGFEAGQTVTVRNATTAGNNIDYILKSVSATTLTFQTGTITTADAAGPSVTISRSSAWAASKVRKTGAYVTPVTPNGYQYECTTAGTSGASEPVTWGTTIGGTTTDNTVTWTCRASSPVQISEIAMWTGSSFAVVSNLSDGSNGASKSGYVTFSPNTSIKKYDFNGSIYAYWYRVKINSTIGRNVSIGLQYMPYFDIDDDYYPIGQACMVWKGRAVYSFNDDNTIYFSARNEPMTLNGDDGKGFISCGDGRKNKVLALVPFYNEAIAFQEEKGKEGGCVTLIEGNAPSGSGKFDSLVLSTNIGIVNAKAVVGLEYVNVEDTNKNYPVASAAFFISRQGVYRCGGMSVIPISQKIQNYFDSSKTECIRRGYESKHYLRWDSYYRVIRMGLVSGTSATMPNVFFIYDPVTGSWSTDTLAQPLSDIVDVEAASGDIPVIQIGGGQDGFVYNVNTGLNDVSTAIDAQVVIELNAQGHMIIVSEETLRCKAQTVGTITREVALGGNTTFSNASLLPQTAITSGDKFRRHRPKTGFKDDHISIRWRNNTVNESMYLLDVGFGINEVINKA